VASADHVPPCHVQENFVWMVDENHLLWWRLLGDEFVEIAAGADGLLASTAFPGLVVDSKALLAGDLAAVLAGLD
jgi:hypothetical protein